MPSGEWGGNSLKILEVQVYWVCSTKINQTRNTKYCCFVCAVKISVLTILRKSAPLKDKKLPTNRSIGQKTGIFHFVCANVQTHVCVSVTFRNSETNMIGSGAALQTASSLTHSVSQSVRKHFPPSALRRRNVQTVRVSSSSYKIDYVNPEGHQNPINGSKLQPFYWRGQFCLLVELQRWRVCDQRCYPV